MRLHIIMRPLAWLGLIGVIVASCDFKVVNPGPAQDEFLDRAAAHEAAVNGGQRAFNNAWGDIALLGASVAREIFPAGTTGRFGIDAPAQRGLLPPDQTNDYWNAAQRARWVSEDAVRRLERAIEPADFAKSAVVARAFLWAGYTNRFMGENFCEAVIDGGPVEPHTVFLQRAAAHFTEAIEIAAAAGVDPIGNAARAGRASVRLYLREFDGALADASAVPAGFRYQTPFSALEEDQYNHIYWGVANTPYRKHSTWNTVYEFYYPETQDPRVSWSTNASFPVGDAGVGSLGQIRWFFQTKYTRLDQPVNLSTEREMRLIAAEVALVEGDWSQAMQIINTLRAQVGVVPWQVSNVAEAWTALKRERGIELWLEGRRLGDLRRWQLANTPGALHPRELASEDNYLAADRALCFPVANSERETNPNLR